MPPFRFAALFTIRRLTLALLSMTVLGHTSASASGNPPAPLAEQTLRIGVLAFRGTAKAIQRWTPTADYLSQHLPGYRFQIVPLNLNGMSTSLLSNSNTLHTKLDFVLTNPGNYVTLSAEHGVSRLATFVGKGQANTRLHLASVIFTRRSSNIHSLKDLRGHAFAAISKKAFGGFQLAWKEMKTVGIDPFTDLSALTFSGFPHSKVVDQVMSGEAEAGVMRAGLLEELAGEGKIQLDQIRILAEKQHPQFEYKHSSDLYPEWPFARARHVDDQLARKVAIALYAMPQDSIAAVTAKGQGWTIPLDYSGVRQLLYDLKIGPYASPPLTVWELLRTYLPWIAGVMLALTLLIGISIHILRINRRLANTQTQLRRHQQELEERVLQRTEQLSISNNALAEDIQIRTNVENHLRRNNQSLYQLYDAFVDTGVSHEQRLRRVLLLAKDYLQADSGHLFRLENNELQLCTEAHTKTSHTQTMADTNETIPLVAEQLTQWTQTGPSPKPIDSLPQIIRPENQQDTANYLAIPVTVGRRLHCLLEFRGLNTPEDQQDMGILLLVAQWLSNEIETRENAEKHRQHREQLAHFNRISTLGELTLSIAHEINQPLTAALNYINGCLRRINTRPLHTKTINEGLKKASDNIDKASEILQHLRDFVRGDTHHKQACDITQAVRIVCELTAADCNNQQIAVYSDLRHDKALVFTDPIHIQQILFNLIRNSMDALKKQTDDHPEIIIESRVLNDELILSVKDNGRGLGTSQSSEYFIDAFITTKEEGMGMGLSICRTLAEASQGSISIINNPYRGAKASLRLPLHHASSKTKQPHTSQHHQKQTTA